MRITDTPCLISANNGLVHFECAGVTASFEPDAAARAGGGLIERIRAAGQNTVRQTAECGLRTGEQLIASAAEAMRQRAATLAPLSAAA